MNIAILGPRGFVGRKLIPLLEAQGHLVTGYVLDPKTDGSNGVYSESVLELLKLPSSKVKKYDVVINLAARRSTRIQTFTESEVHYFTYEIPKEFISRTANSSTLVLNSSTYIQNFKGVTGRTVDSYGAAKEKLSQFLERQSLKQLVPTRDLYFFTMYGKGDRPGHLIPLLLKAANTGEKILLSPGYQLMNLLYVDDAVQNILKCISQKPIPQYQKSRVWSDEYFSVRELVSKIQSVIGQDIDCEWGKREYVGHEMMEPWPVPMKELPGFDAPTSLESGIRKIWREAELDL